MAQLAPHKLVLVSLFLFLTQSLMAQNLMRIYYPDIEQGASTLVVAPNGHALLIDGGSGINEADVSIEGFINDLMDAGIVVQLDYIMATHYDEDHIGRLENVFQYVALPPGLISYDRGLYGGTPTTFAYSDYSYHAGQHQRTTLTPNTLIQLGGGVSVRCVVVNGQLPDGSSVDITNAPQFENAASAAFLISYGDFQVWVGGDLVGNTDYHPAVEQAASAFVGDVDIYTCDHHGSSATSSDATFLATLSAEIGINQNSVVNNFGHPTATVVSRFKNTPDTFNNFPLWFQTNPGNPTDTRSDDLLADGIADPDDVTSIGGAPGTITVVSDGGCYQVYGGHIEPVSRLVDSGSHSLANFPPAILQTQYAPLVPSDTETITVEAEIRDDASISAAVLYWVNDVAQTPIAMTEGPTGHYQGTIPAQGDAAKIVFPVEAIDSASQAVVSSRTGFFSGVTPISVVREEDSNGVLLTNGYLARVRGTVTAEPGLFHSSVSQVYVESGGTGINVFHNTLMTINRGDLVELTGALEQFGGVSQLVTAGSNGVFGYSVISSGAEPTPALKTLAQLNELTESTLVRVDNVTIVSGTIPESGEGNLDITDDGGVTVRTLRIDGETDIPGANTPLTSFSVIGLVSQYDSSVPLTYGYRLVPRSRTDILSAEVNHSAVVIAEINADPDTVLGDANGDGVVSSDDDEFIELVNTTYAAVDISGYTLSDANSVRFTFPANTVVPAREAAVVFGGGSPTGDFGNAMANGLVFTTSTLSLNNGGDTITLADGSSVVQQVVVYGSEAGANTSLVRSADWSNGPLVKHLIATPERRFGPGVRLDGSAYTLSAGKLVLSEVMYDPSGADTDAEWIELANISAETIDLSQLSLGAGGSSYTSTLVQLEGSLAAGEVFLVGGSLSSASNGNPSIDQVVSFSLQNSGTEADGVALFNIRAAAVTSTTVPIDAVIYGTSNLNNLLDETGAPGTPDVGDAPSGATLERTSEAGDWVMQGLPSPNASPLLGAVVETGSPSDVIITEVFYDYNGTDDGLEWIELYNKGSLPVNLTTMSLGSGGGDYIHTTIQLSGTIPAGATWVVGGSSSDAGNGSPVYDLALNFSPDLQNSGSVADGVALFDVPANQITTTTVPVDAVVFGTSNSDNLIDETGSANVPEVGDAPAGSSIERTNLSGSWQIQASPAPGAINF